MRTSGDLVPTWEREERQPFSGWDFSHLAGRWNEEHPPWSYEELARAALRDAASALDLGTGGGERLARLADALPRRTVATEGYRPNLEVARARLAPLDVRVVASAAGGALPFAGDAFGVVLDRHTAYDAREVARVLVPGGTFLTQQVDGRNHADLLKWFDASPSFPDLTLERHVADLRASGFVIEQAEEWWGRSVFRDVGALVYYLKAVPWTVSGFSVARFAPVLRRLHAQIAREGPLEFRCGQFLILARH